ncbi:MAG: hypothetical protein E6J90_07905 [Deltaproteobacteria bacterium]|nr:MAG: hypothetical protein E6J90_07905 [Deltaproteobacteria bacterium]
MIGSLAGCTAPSHPPDVRDAAPEIDDVRVPIPAADPSFVDMVSPELRLEPGHEAIYCYYLDNPIGRFGSDHIEARQGMGGHHIGFRHASTHQPSGTFADCTSDQETRQLGDLFVGNDLPAGWATEIPADAQFVLEMHYINAGELPLLARDVIRIHRLPDAQITKWLHAMHLKIYDLVIGPGETTLAFTCTVPEDLALYTFWGHQHALGKRQQIDVTPPGSALYSLYDVTWGMGALVQGSNAEPVMLTAGSQIDVTCTWSPAGTVLRFPDEMCAFGGFVEGVEFSCAPPSRMP